MRITIDLDPDVYARLRALARQRGVSLVTVIGDELRAGVGTGSSDATPYTLPSRRLGVRTGVALDKALRLAARQEDEERAREFAPRN
jgi:hypothetical protein